LRCVFFYAAREKKSDVEGREPSRGILARARARV
jgi:hypothetical protein